MNRTLIHFLCVFVMALNAMSASYYVDYVGGADTSAGTSTGAAWKHCPGDPSATSTALAATLAAGDTVFFKGGVTYVFTSTLGVQIASGTVGSRITYDGNSAGNWGTGRAIFTDNGGTNRLVCFNAPNSGSMANITFNSLVLGPVGGGVGLPADPGFTIPDSPGVGIGAGGVMLNVTVENCLFTGLGYWQNTRPAGGGTCGGQGVLCTGSSNLVVTNCEFTKVAVACEFTCGTGGITNLTVENCLFHDYIIWGIDLPAAANQVRSNLFIHDLCFSNWDWAYSDNVWSGYSSNNVTVNGTGGPHMDGIFDRADNVVDPGDGGNPANHFFDTNFYFYNIYFVNEHAISGGTAAIWFLDTPGAYVYGCVFNCAHELNQSIELTAHTNNVNRLAVYNCTFVQIGAPSIGVTGAYSDVADAQHSFWPQNGSTVDFRNNVFYEANNSSSFLINEGITNTFEPYVTINFDCAFDAFSTITTFDWFQFSPTTLNDMRTVFTSAPGGGWELNGGYADPKFIDISHANTSGAHLNNLQVATNSPALNAGTNLTALGLPGFTTDILGNARPATGNWTQGAYQMSQQVPVPLPAGIMLYYGAH